MDASIFKGCLGWGKLSQVVEKEKKMIDVSAASPWVKPAQGLIRLAKQAPHPPAPVTPHSHRIFSHYSGADRWASFCISAVHFLKSEKPIHLGQTQKEKEEEAATKEKLQNFSFFFSSSLLLTACVQVSLVGTRRAPASPLSIASPRRRRWCSPLTKRIHTVSLVER